jgi:putative Holliday junction resolvase
VRILSIDYGTKRIGMAISDESGSMALAYGTEDRGQKEADSKLAERLARRIEGEGVDEVVVGLPRSMNGQRTAMSRRAARFAKLLGERLSIPVRTWDERLSTQEARHRLRDASISRRKKRQHLNVVAAQVILEEYLKQRE